MKASNNKLSITAVIQKSDYIIENIDLDQTKLQVEQIHHQLTKIVV